MCQAREPQSRFAAQEMGRIPDAFDAPIFSAGTKRGGTACPVTIRPKHTSHAFLAKAGAIPPVVAVCENRALHRGSVGSDDE